MSLRDWTKKSGAFTINELSADDAVLKHLTTGTKYLECTSSGIIAIPSKQAYGTWEFDIIVNVGGFAVLNFISDRNENINGSLGNGYTYILDGANKRLFLRLNNFGSNSNLFYTANNYISTNTWYRIKVTRTITGVFTVWVKGGTFGDTWTLVSTTGGFGSNPVTDNTYNASNYFVAVLNPGGKIANIKFYDGVRQ